MTQHSSGGTPKTARTVGVEEELLLVDSESGLARSVAHQVLRVAERRGDTQSDNGKPGGSLGPELQEQQVETDTPPERDLDDLGAELVRWREKARAAAEETGALVLASGTTPLPVQPRAFGDPRYVEITERFGLTASEQLSCGCHVHVSVNSEDEAVGAMDRIRAWLPALLALSSNSPFWQGRDSGYESYRSQVLTRWPTSGPTQLHGDARGYAEHLRQLVDTGVPLDEGMAYFDVRPSQHYPTLEIRVADVCLDPQDTVLVAALCRALVDTASEEWRDEVPPDQASVALLRLATWQAGRHGLSGSLLDPATHRQRPAREVVDALVAHVAPALQRSGDLARVEHRLDHLFTAGTGAATQRAILEKQGRLDRAVVELARMSAAPPD
ncbi:MAG TPA: glutamate--cysteine ligase [Nocardioides sp.]